MLQYHRISTKTSGGLTSKATRLISLLKWAGGKEQELKYILPLIPPFERYFEPFVGGGAVFFSIQAPEKFINDKSLDLFNLYMMVAQHNQTFFEALETLLRSWQQIGDIVDQEARHLIALYKAYSIERYTATEMEQRLLEFIMCHSEAFQAMFIALFNIDVENFMRELRRNLISKTRRMKQLEHKKWLLPDGDIVANIEGALKSAFYMHLRYLYNNISQYNIPLGVAAAIFFFVRENAYASMFRYNSQGALNVPYGGITYNRKDLARKVAYMQSTELQAHLCHTVIENMDFSAFLLKYLPQANDFVFLDPPYDSEFSTYAQNAFDIRDQERLANYLLHDCKARFMLVIKNTPAILSLYDQKGLIIRAFDKKYLVSFQDRNNREVEHLIITNY